MQMFRFINRDTRRRVWARLFDTCGIFVYQGAVFLAQWTLVMSLECQDESVGDTELCVKATGPTYFWILMEAIVFYSYMGSKCIYILFYTCRSSITQREDTDSDINKQTQDFLTYEKLNLTWFAFNFVLIVLPPFLMFTVDHELDGNNLNGKDESFEFIMYIIWIMHIVQFLANTEMIVKVKEDEGAAVEGENTEPLMGEEKRSWDFRPAAS